MRLTRRQALAAAVASGLAVGSSAESSHSDALAKGRQTHRRPPLSLKPPHLRRPTVIDLSHETMDSGYFELYGEGRDWIVRLPRDRPHTQGIVLDGRSEARNVVIVGGAILPAATSDLKTTTSLNGGGYSVYALRGFSGATGGTFTILTAEEDGRFTMPLAWNAAPGEIQAGIEAVLGSGSVRAVAGPDTPGGPWKFVPADSRLGRVALDLSGLEGTVEAIDGENVYVPASPGLLLKDITGTVHLEGIQIGGQYCSDGIGVQTPFASSAVQIASCHIVCSFFYYNHDWQHPDGMQCYLGPASLQIERSDLITFGTTALIGQPRMSDVPEPLQLLRDWWFQDVLFQTRFNADNPTRTPGDCCYQIDGWPALNTNDANWHWVMHNCYASRIAEDGREDPTPTYLTYWAHYPFKPPRGLALGRTPPHGTFASPALNYSGDRYRSPGYTRVGVALGTPRLRGNTKLT